MLVTDKEALDNGDDAQQSGCETAFSRSKGAKKAVRTEWFGSQRVAGNAESTTGSNATWVRGSTSVSQHRAY
jgi:hypothetical protein